MAKLSKNRKDAISKVDSNSTYSTLEAAKLVKETFTEKFDASVDKMSIHGTLNHVSMAPVSDHGPWHLHVSNHDASSL